MATTLTGGEYRMFGCVRWQDQLLGNLFGVQKSSHNVDTPSKYLYKSMESPCATVPILSPSLQYWRNFLSQTFHSKLLGSFCSVRSHQHLLERGDQLLLEHDHQLPLLVRGHQRIKKRFAYNGSWLVRFHGFRMFWRISQQWCSITQHNNYRIHLNSW